jgi:hypothetical protein
MSIEIPPVVVGVRIPEIIVGSPNAGILLPTLQVGARVVPPVLTGAKPGMIKTLHVQDGVILYGASAKANTVDLNDNIVTLAKLQQIATGTVLGRGTGGTGDAEVLTVGSGLQISGGVLAVDAVLDEEAANTVYAGPASGADATPTFRALVTNDLPNDGVTYAKLQNVSATSRVLGRKTSGAGDAEELTLSEVLDFISSAAQGDILYRGASAWARLGAGTAGQVLKTNGTGANPAWVNGLTEWGGGTPINDTDTGTAHTYVLTSSHAYFCHATNSWRRVATS